MNSGNHVVTFCRIRIIENSAFVQLDYILFVDYLEFLFFSRLAYSFSLSQRVIPREGQRSTGLVMLFDTDR